MELFWFAFISVSFLIMGLYTAMIFYAISGWNKLQIEADTSPTLSISILIAARNESSNILAVLEDLSTQNYPKELFEVIVIDDYSDDDTLALAKGRLAEMMNLTVLENKAGEGKKSAIAEGISRAKFPIIATIDDDCSVFTEWLQSMASHWKSNTKMLLGPVVLAPAEGVFQTIQSMEMMAIMGLTGGFASQGKPIMANGANLWFDKSAFNEVGGFSKQQNPSGDDVFTMLKINDKWPQSVGFVKDFRAIVQTTPQPTFSAFWQQRKRWLSKKGEYSNWMVKATALTSYFANVIGLLALLISIAMLGTFVSDTLLWILLVKTVVDLYIIRRTRNDLNPICGVGSIIPAELFMLFYVPILGIFGRVKNYTWKGRSISVND